MEHSLRLAELPKGGVVKTAYQDIIERSRAEFGKRKPGEPKPATKAQISAALADAKQAEIDEQERIKAERTKPKQQAMF